MKEKPPKTRPQNDEEGSLGPIDVTAWRRELMPLYSEAFLANRSESEIIELVRALGRLGVELPRPGQPARRVRHRTADERRQKFIDEAVAIEQTSAQEAGMLGYMARVLVQATMPHSSTPERQFLRSNGNLTISITALGNQPLPFGSYPRLLLAWLSTEAVRTHESEIVLGDSLSTFMGKLGLLPTGGRWGTIPRFRQAAVSLFASAVACFYDDEEHSAGEILKIADKYNLWWDPKNPDQIGLWRSTVRLSEQFFREVTTRPVPIDLRAVKALKQSPMALDLYCWATYRVSYLKRPTEIPWELLKMQFGADYADTKQGRYEFKRTLLMALRRGRAGYRELRAEEGEHGLKLAPSRAHILPR